MTGITLKDLRPSSAADASAAGYHIEEIQRRPVHSAKNRVTDQVDNFAFQKSVLPGACVSPRRGRWSFCMLLMVLRPSKASATTRRQRARSAELTLPPAA